MRVGGEASCKRRGSEKKGDAGLDLKMEEGTTGRGAQWCLEAGEGKKHGALECLEGPLPHGHRCQPSEPPFGLLTSRAVRQYICVILSHKVWVNCPGSQLGLAISPSASSPAALCPVFRRLPRFLSLFTGHGSLLSWVFCSLHGNCYGVLDCFLLFFPKSGMMVPIPLGCWSGHGLRCLFCEPLLPALL